LSIRKREWTTKKKGKQSAWVVDYTDQNRERRHKTFTHKRLAEEFHATARIEVRDKVHVPASASITVEEAGKRWLDAARDSGLEQTTIDQYEQHLRLHILPFLGRRKLSDISIPDIAAFQAHLRSTEAPAGKNGKPGRKRSSAMVRGITTSLSALLSLAQEQGLLLKNAVRERPKRRSAGNNHNHRKAKLRVGIDIPQPGEIARFLKHAEGRWRPLFLTAVFTGLRASELRGLK
jgi:integrase